MEKLSALGSRLLWFIGLWCGGVLAVTTIGFILRRWLIGG